MWLKPGNMNMWFPTPLVTEPLALQAGTVTYIGEFRSVGCANVSIRNSALHRERDLEKLKEVSPGIDVSAIRVVYPALRQ
jgi:hypothetical protein